MRKENEALRSIDSSVISKIVSASSRKMSNLSMSRKVKIKVLKCPLWIRNGRYPISFKFEFDEIEPLFRRDGYYLINNKHVIIEYQGTAWKSKNDELSVRTFYWEFERAEYEGINILSKEQSDAIYTLMKIKLESVNQRDLFQKDFSKKSSKIRRFELKKRMSYKKKIPKVREKTGAPVFQCLKGLYECKGDIEKSVEWVKQNPGFYL